MLSIKDAENQNNLERDRNMCVPQSVRVTVFNNNSSVTWTTFRNISEMLSRVLKTNKDSLETDLIMRKISIHEELYGPWPMYGHEDIITK